MPAIRVVGPKIANLAKSIFFDDFGVQFFDDEHSSDEESLLMLGMSSSTKLLIVCHCERDHSLREVRARKVKFAMHRMYQFSDFHVPAVRIVDGHPQHRRCVFTNTI